MTDPQIESSLNYYRSARNRIPGTARDMCERAISDITRLAGAIDGQREAANQLAEISERLRGLVAGRGLVLKHIRDYARKAGSECKCDHGRHAIGTIANMVDQRMDVEQSEPEKESECTK